MAKHFSFFFKAIMASFFSLPLTPVVSQANDSVVLIQDGEAMATLYASSSEDQGSIEAALETAIKEIHYHFEQMTGTGLSVVRTDNPTDVQTPALVLGKLAVQMGAEPRKGSESREGFRLLTRDGLVLIGGESDDGTLFGVYELLRVLGCDWVMPDKIGEIIPKVSNIAVPAQDRSEAPGFLIRTQYYGGGPRATSEKEAALFDQWRLRSGKGEYNHPAMQTRGHYWDVLIRKHKQEFDQDPTMYALVRLPDGSLVRRGPQVESTHPRVIELITQDIRDTFEKNNWPKDKAVGFPFGPADGSAFSQSVDSLQANSTRVDVISGREDVTDLMVLLGNQIFEKLGEEYPNVWLGYYVYAQYSNYPLRYKPHPRMVPIFASINYSRHYSSLDPRSKTRAQFRKVVEKWGALSKEQGNFMISRDFNYNLAEGMSPVTKLAVWGEEIPFYHRMGVSAFLINSAKAWAIHGPQNYVLQRLMWDPALEWRDLLSDYCRHSFGAGAAAMERYFDRLVQTQKDAGQEAGSYHALHLIFGGDFVRDSETDIQAALEVATTGEDRTRIGYIADGLQSLRLYLDYHQATLDFDFVRAEKLFQAMQTHQQTMLDKDAALTSSSPTRYMGRFLKTFVEGAVQYSTGTYQLVAQLPDEMPTLLDPNVVGEEMEYFRPEIVDRDWIRTKTYSTTWDAQGLSNFRIAPWGGAVWYRWRFVGDDLPVGESLGLFLGGFDDEARVWLNGEFIGSSGRSFSHPAVYDLSGAMQEGENMLVIAVVRNSILNELGTGGLLRPSFLFRGPKLERQAAVLPEEIAEKARQQHLEMIREGEQAY